MEPTPYRFENSLPDELLQQRQQPRVEDIRGRYFRDTTAIIHCNPFRRLKHKTQVFFSPKNDHICTRIEHVMHVASIAAAVCRGLDLDADLAWAIGLGHDLGHTPFGHVGEHIMADIRKDSGGFVHELYSLRVVDHLIGYGKGLNLTYAVRDGIVSHCGEKFEQSIIPVQEMKDLGALTGRNHLPSTWEGAVVRMADKIAYLGRDLEDALQLKIVKREDVPEEVVANLGAENGVIINTLVSDLIDTSRKSGAVAFSDEKYHAMKVLTEFNYRNIYRNPLLSDYHRYFDRILRSLYDYLEELFDRYRFDEGQYRREKNLLAVRFGDYVCKMRSFYEGEDGGFRNLAVDYVAGMTDDYALECIQEIMLPQKMETQFDQFLLGN
ncbi:deoxyguanosinetriphosphate triphosphohydrolase family protein [Sediminispirochaeta bajacaliforniensis]|uniref:deoxyguanosinetriphosphate triphosphohydrolase family protein n=1 Tax=Sediminispirochaeta bajacaliforniensis TaxID=148 RepID=UPI00039F8797|nr:HD domain-containing protein [Sediminispirochaeta bajacaliforniensis]